MESGYLKMERGTLGWGAGPRDGEGYPRMGSGTREWRGVPRDGERDPAMESSGRPGSRVARGDVCAAAEALCKHVNLFSFLPRLSG